MLSEDSLHIFKVLFSDRKVNRLNINSDTREWLMRLYDKIKNIQASTLKFDKIVECKTLEQEQYISDRFTSAKIKKDILKIKDCSMYNILNTDIVIGNNCSENVNMQHITNIISIMRSLSDNNGHILINIWNTHHKKHLPKHCNRLEPENINSGATLPGHYINLWRMEELYKVLIHELIHTFFLDFRDDTDNKYKKGLIEDYLRNTVNIKQNSPVYIQESYTEFLAILIHSIYISKSFEMFIKILSCELDFNFLQCAKILNHFNCSNNSDLFSNKCQIEYDTDVLSYFYIKTALLQSLNESVNFMNQNNTNIINFNDNSQKDYLKLIDFCIKNKEFIEKINKNIKNIKNCNDTILKNSLRMTLFQNN